MTPSIRDRLYHHLQAFDYGTLLPALATLPVPVGEALANGRGVLNAIFDLDWRSLSLRQRYIRGATYRAMQQLLPQRHRLTHATKTAQRFIHNSREEWEACLFANRHRFEPILERGTVVALEPLLQIQRAGRGMVLLTLHYDSFCLGITLLGHRGLRVNVVTSSVVEDPRVHPAVRSFYTRKYRAMEQYMNGGRMVHFEHDLRYFYRALARGDAVVVLADLPPATPKTYQVTVPFLNGPKRMAGGALRMAEKTDSVLGAFICRHRGAGRYTVQCASPREITADNPVTSLTPLYAFLEGYLHQAPERWWAADLRLHYQEMPHGPQHD